MNFPVNDFQDWAILEDAWEERAAILQFDAGLHSYEAEQLAAQQMGFKNKFEFKEYIQELKAYGKL